MKTLDTPESASPTDDLIQQTIILDEPLQRGTQTIAAVEIRMPSSRELRGVSLLELSQLDVASLQKVLPRITSPTLMPPDIDKMAPSDLLACGMAVAAFLLKKAQRREVFQST